MGPGGATCLARTVTGKVQKYMMRKQSIRLLVLERASAIQNA